MGDDLLEASRDDAGRAAGHWLPLHRGPSGPRSGFLTTSSTNPPQQPAIHHAGKPAELVRAPRRVHNVTTVRICRGGLVICEGGHRRVPPCSADGRAKVLWLVRGPKRAQPAQRRRGGKSDGSLWFPVTDPGLRLPLAARAAVLLRLLHRSRLRHDRHADCEYPNGRRLARERTLLFANTR